MSANKKQSAASEISNSEESKRSFDVVIKFRAYRTGAEFNEKKLKEAEALLYQLKNEISFSRNVEKNLRAQISAGEDRIVALQKLLGEFSDISQLQRRNEKMSSQIEERVNEFEKEILKARRESQNFFQYVSKDAELLKKIKHLELILSTTENECEFKKMEIQTLTKEKENMKTEFQQKLTKLENEVENAVKKEKEATNTLEFYKQQIDDYEQKIEVYEKDRKSFLEDFAPRSPIPNITIADSTVNLNSEERLSNSKKLYQTQSERDRRVFQCSSSSGGLKITSSQRKNTISKRKTAQHKPQLEFLSQLQAISQKDNFVEHDRKRRLFSTNCNHYIE